MSVTFFDKAPSTQLFIDFRAECGWGIISNELAKTAIDNSLLWISAYADDEVIGFVRLIGDGALNYYIQDLIVDSSYREQGIGRALMEKLLSLCAGVVPDGATIGLMAVHGKEPFYEELGFQSRPVGRFGAGMTMCYDSGLKT